MSSTLVLTHPACDQHRPPGHPERPERIAAIEGLLAAPEFVGVRRSQLDLGAGPIPGAAEGRRLAGRVHDPGYVEAVFAIGEERFREGAGSWLDADTFVGPGSLAAACAGLLSAREAAAQVLQGTVTSAFSLCRPPGHHATRSTAMGFCLLNNAAAAAQSALDAGMERVAVMDFDVHHGNGTQDIFYQRRDVLYVSTHQWPLYPGSGSAEERGRGEGEGYTVNLPLPAGTGDAGYLEVFETDVLPALDAYRPQLLVVSAGFDAHRRDPLAQMEVTTEGFSSLATRLLDAAARLCEGRSVWILEGGYDLQALAEGAVGCIRAAI